eukprot:1548844-Pleurochrysis_carterae.AAC.6
MRGVSNRVLTPQVPSMLRMLAVLLMAVGKSGAARPTAVIRHVQLPAAHSMLPKSVVAGRTPEDHVSCRKLDRRSALIGVLQALTCFCLYGSVSFISIFVPLREGMHTTRDEDC